MKNTGDFGHIWLMHFHEKDPIVYNSLFDCLLSCKSTDDVGKILTKNGFGRTESAPGFKYIKDGVMVDVYLFPATNQLSVVFKDTSCKDVHEYKKNIEEFKQICEMAQYEPYV